MKIFKTMLILLMAFAPVLTTAQAPLTATKYVKSTHPVNAQATAVDNTNNQDATRITVSLVSQPNTSSRIDSVHLNNGKAVLAAVDIDGVDFGRYFQWEEDGVINVDVDFPRQKKFVKNATVVFHTVHGDIIADLSPVFKAKRFRK